MPLFKRGIAPRHPARSAASPCAQVAGSSPPAGFCDLRARVTDLRGVWNCSAQADHQRFVKAMPQVGRKLGQACGHCSQISSMVLDAALA